MVDTRRNGDWASDPIRSDGGRRVPGSGPLARSQKESGIRGRIPTVRELASLLVNGILTLPRNYRRGMYLDVQI